MNQNSKLPQGLLSVYEPCNLKIQTTPVLKKKKKLKHLLAQLFYN